MNKLLDILWSDRVINEEFRLWITCDESKSFPLALLQRVIKVTEMPPLGIKAGMNKTFTATIT